MIQFAGFFSNAVFSIGLTVLIFVEALCADNQERPNPGHKPDCEHVRDVPREEAVSVHNSPRLK